MKNVFPSLVALLAALPAFGTPSGQYRVPLSAANIVSTSPQTDLTWLVDEQRDIGDPPSGSPESGGKGFLKQVPASTTIDFGSSIPVSTLWLYDTNDKGEIKIFVGSPEKWSEVASYDCGKYKAWGSVPVETETRYVKLTAMSGGANVSEIALDAYSPKGWESVKLAKAEASRLAAQKQEALKKAKEEALKRPLVKVEPYGTLSLVEEIDMATLKDETLTVSPAGASRVETILGRPARVLNITSGESAMMTVRIGRMKMLRPGAAYVLSVDYPEDAPRSFVVINTGNETSRGFSTGVALGDALHPKYVNNFDESLDLPLSGKWETWTLLVHLHDRFAETGLVRGSDRPRSLNPEDGFDVTIGQFAEGNDPLSKGAAVGKIRLYEVIDEATLALKINFPPKELPRRHLFWREEMADGLIGGKEAKDRGIDDPIEWYRQKAERMRFLGMNTYTKDLLEFGACQGWDSTPYGGNKWVYFNNTLRNLWPQIVELMGQYGFDVLPYYEYSGSKGQESLGNKRLCKPLTRDDNYTHIKWMESSNADLTDPATYDDFKKMIDLTVINLQDKAKFVGVWLRNRQQMPISFGPGALARFGTEANQGVTPTRDQIKADKKLYDRYLRWWETKRRDFLVAMRDYMREKGIADAQVLFTGEPGEPGVGFGSWDARFVTDRPDLWKPILAKSPHTGDDGSVKWTVLTPSEVVQQGLYLKGLLSPGLTWGGWEGQHSRPADDPLTYRDVDGVMLTHAFNRLYTVSSPETLATFKTKSGLALVRHYSLNENMFYGKNDEPKAGYFVADVERAGPYCMQAEAVAMANGDPTMIGYLSGGNFGRGFPQYVRDFNANFLALPALPSERVEGASSDKDVVVRTIKTNKFGTYIAIVNTASTAKTGVTVKLATTGVLKPLAEGTQVKVSGNTATLDLRPYQLVSMHLQ